MPEINTYLKKNYDFGQEQLFLKYTVPFFNLIVNLMLKHPTLI